MKDDNCLFSTRNLYDSKFVGDMLFAFIPFIVAEILFFVFLPTILSFIFSLIWGIAVGKGISKFVLMKQSYVDLQKDTITGVSMEKSEMGIPSFTIKYSEIVHIDTAMHQIILHTAYAKYRVQAYECVDEVKEIITSQMNK